MLAATLDHLESRWSPTRLEMAKLNGRNILGDGKATVLACYGCNQKRNDEEQKAKTVEEELKNKEAWKVFKQERRGKVFLPKLQFQNKELVQRLKIEGFKIYLDK